MTFSSSWDIFVLIKPTAWSAKLSSDITCSAGFFCELKGGVCTAMRQSRLRARKREAALKGNWHPPSVYRSSIGFVSLCLVRRLLSSVAWRWGLGSSIFHTYTNSSTVERSFNRFRNVNYQCHTWSEWAASEVMIPNLKCLASSNENLLSAIHTCHRVSWFSDWNFVFVVQWHECCMASVLDCYLLLIPK